MQKLLKCFDADVPYSGFNAAEKFVHPAICCDAFKHYLLKLSRSRLGNIKCSYEYENIGTEILKTIEFSQGHIKEVYDCEHVGVSAYVDAKATYRGLDFFVNFFIDRDTLIVRTNPVLNSDEEKFKIFEELIPYFQRVMEAEHLMQYRNIHDLTEYQKINGEYFAEAFIIFENDETRALSEVRQKFSELSRHYEAYQCFGSKNKLPPYGIRDLKINPEYNSELIKTFIKGIKPRPVCKNAVLDNFIR